MKHDLADLLERIILEAIQPLGCAKIALLFSGGVDSLSLGFAARELGIEVHAYTFRIDGKESEDFDAAIRAADALGWEFTPVTVTTNNLAARFIELARKWNCKKKTQFECTFPFVELANYIDEPYVLSGIAADGHFGLSKKAMIHFRRPKELFDTFRRGYFASENPAGQLQQKAVLAARGLTQIAPYLDPRVFDYFIRFNWDDINSPVQKQITLNAYPVGFSKVKARKHANLQLVAKVDEVFETLLGDPAININGRTRVQDLCRDWADDQTTLELHED